MTDPKKILLLIIFISVFACGEYEVLEIDKSAKRVSDSLFRVDRDSLAKHFEEQCSVKRDSIFRVYFDSLREVEAEKIKRLIEK